MENLIKHNVVSVVVPAFNVFPYLSRCVESLLAQSHKALQIILVDDGSTDGTSALCDNFARRDERIQVLHTENQGASCARNAGLGLVRGEAVCFVDSDDAVSPFYVERLYSLLKGAEADISVVRHEVFYGAGPSAQGDDFYPDGPLALISGEEAVRQLLYDRISVSAWAKMYTRDMAQYFRFPEGKHFEDTECTIRLFSRAARVAVADDHLYCYLIREGSISTQHMQDSSFDRAELAFRAYEFVEETYPAFHAAAQRFLLAHTLAVLRMPCDRPEDYQQRIDNLVAQAQRLAPAVLRDSQASMRDKCGALSILMGYDAFKHCWAVYSKVRRG